MSWRFSFRVPVAPFAALWLAASLAACEGSADLAVDLRTDLVPGVEFDRVHATLDGADAPLHPASLADDFGHPRRVAEFPGTGHGVRSLVVELERGGEVVLSRRTMVRLEGSLIVTVVLTRDCRGVACPGDGSATSTECLGGRCVDPNCSSANPEACPPAECDADADCASSAACVVAACVDGVCLSAPVSERCEVGEYCSPSDGCVLRPDVDAGPIDAGVDAGRVPPEAVFLGSGGGEASSAGHRVRLNIGAPVPAGAVRDATHRATLGGAAAGR